MYVESAKLTFRLLGSFSLKDKRQVRRSIVDKIRSRFNVSVAEVGTQDVYQMLTLGVSVVSGDFTHAEQMLDEVIRYMEENADAELVEVERF